jgi:hypothetical protein
MNKQALIFVFCLLSCSSAMAMDEAGKAIMARGDVTAKAEVESRALVRRSPVFKEDLVSTGSNSVTQLRMVDGGLLSVQPLSELAIANYEFDAQSTQGNVSMSLLKGGLRTVTGALQKNGDNYQMKTPVASIGVRGTHYEAEMLEGDLYLATWHGIIDIEVLAGTQNQHFSLGPELAYKFAIVRANGEVEFLLGVPAVFSAGHSNVEIDILLANEDLDTVPLVMGKPAEELAILPVINTKASQEFFDNSRLVSSWLPYDYEISSRTGVATYNQLEQDSVVSSVGQISGLNISVNVDFDTARVPTGNLSFSDSAGEWFAVFNGVIEQGSLDISVNFASHANNLAEGEINGLLIDSASGVLGNFNLTEVDDNNVHAGGAFVIRTNE